jgi:hypothetical protein
MRSSPHRYDFGILLFDSYIERIRVGLHNRELARVQMQWVEHSISGRLKPSASRRVDTRSEH